MPFCVVKFSVSPLIRPLLIVTVAPVRLVAPSPSLMVRPVSSATGVVLPPAKVTVPPAVTLGPASTVTVLVSVALVLWLVLPSLTTQSIVRVPSVVAVVLNVIEFELDLVGAESRGAAQRQDAGAGIIAGGDAGLGGEAQVRRP